VQINDFPALTQTAFEIGGQAPLLFRPAPGFFFGFGPSILADVARSNSAGKLFTFGLQSILAASSERTRRSYVGHRRHRGTGTTVIEPDARPAGVAVS